VTVDTGPVDVHALRREVRRTRNAFRVRTWVASGIAVLVALAVLWFLADTRSTAAQLEAAKADECARTAETRQIMADLFSELRPLVSRPEVLVLVDDTTEALRRDPCPNGPR
jgi:hypothetical protein